jgi:hypothetical protein
VIEVANRFDHFLLPLNPRLSAHAGSPAVRTA